MKAILIDITRCTGCEECVEACRMSHGLEPEFPARKRSGDGLSSRRLTTILSPGTGSYVKKQCLHCLVPGCVGACPVGAIRKTKEGPVVYDRSLCMGCRYCMLSCPVDIPRYEWEKTVPYMQKCDMCADRVLRGERPVCVETCPNGVLEFGEREELLARARERIAARPGRYLERIYGEKEFGGTSVLYIGDRAVEAVGWPGKVGEKSMLSYTWPLISKTPIVAGGVAALLIGVYAVVGRRMKLEAEQAEAKTEERNGEEP